MLTFPLLLTPAEAAERLGVGTGRVVAWAARGLIRASAQSEDGSPLFREHVVAELGERLARDEVPDERRLPRKVRPALWGENSPPIILDCDCMLSSTGGSPHFLCPDAQGLDLARRLTATLAAAAPTDLFFARLAAVAAEAFDRHVGAPERATSR